MSLDLLKCPGTHRDLGLHPLLQTALAHLQGRSAVHQGFMIDSGA